MASNSANVSKLAAADDEKEIREQLAALREDLAGLKTALASYAKDRAAAAQQSAVQGIDSLREAGVQGMRTAGEMAGELRTKAETQVRENPATALAISAGLGFVLGLLTRRS